METLIMVDLKNSYNEVINSYDDIKEIFDESSDNVITIFVSSFEDKVLIDTATLNTIMTLLEKIYANNLALLFFISCLGTLYVCSRSRHKKDFVMLNTVEPKLLKGEIIEKV